MMKRLLSTLLCAAAASAFGANRFERAASHGGATGADWNNAASHSAMQAIVQPGDTVFMAADAAYGSLTFPTSGTLGNQITYVRASTNTAACTGAAGWSAAFDTTLSMVTFTIGANNYITLDGLTWGGIKINISGGGGQGGAVAQASGQSSTGCIIRNVEFAGPGSTQSYGLWIAYSGGNNTVASLTVEYCFFHDLVNGMQIYNTSNLLIRHNEFTRVANGTDGTHSNIGYMTGTQNRDVFVYNYIHDMNALGFGYEDGCNCISNFWGYNIFANLVGTQNAITTDHNSPTITSMYVVNNTFVNVPVSVNLGGAVSAFLGATNNIYWNSGTPNVPVGAYNRANNFSSANVGSDGGVNSIGNGVFPFTQSNSYQIVTTVAANLPAQKGATLTLNTDFNGNTQGSPWDIGALVATNGSIVVPTVYYVNAQTGSDANTGLSTNAAWKTLPFAIANIGTSNTLMIAGNFPPGSATTINFAGVTLKESPKWSATFHDQPGTLFDTTPGVSHYTVFDGLYFTNCEKHGIVIRGGLSNCVIRNCWAQSTGKSGWAPSQESSGFETLSAYNTLIEDNIAENNGNSAGFDHGIYFGGTNCIVRNNVCRYNNGYGIQAQNTSPNDAPHGNQVYNNLCYGNVGGGEGGQIVFYSTSGSGNNAIFGNTFVAPAGAQAINITGAGIYSITNNIIWSTGNGILTFGGPTIQADYNEAPRATALPGPHDVSSLTANFANTNAGRYWLAVGSPARSAALAGVFGPVDFFGSVQASVTDIGFIQYTAGLAADGRVLDPSPLASAGGPDYWTNITSGGVAPTITVQPVGTNIQVGQSFTLSAAASGTPPFTWTWTNSSGVQQVGTLASFTRSNAQTNDAGSYGGTVTNAFGSAALSVVTVNVTNPVVPAIGISPALLNFGNQLTSTITLLSFTVQNTGSGTLSNVVTCVSPFSVNSGATNILGAGQTATVTIAFNPTTNSLQNGQASCSAGTNVNLTGAGVFVQDPTNMQANLATVLQGMFLSSTNTVFQPIDTSGTGGTPGNSGIAIYAFRLLNLATNGALYANVNAPDDANNSFWTAVDAFPLDPDDVWDVTNFTTGLQFRPISKRGNGTFTSPQFPTNFLSLGPGIHTLTVCGRESNVQLGLIQLLQQASAYVIPPTVTVQPVSQTVLSGNRVSFTSAATGTLPLSPQWYYNSAPINGANQNSFSIASPSPSNNGFYSCNWTNVGGSAMSFAATLTVTNSTVRNVKVHIHGTR